MVLIELRILSGDGGVKGRVEWVYKRGIQV